MIPRLDRRRTGMTVGDALIILSLLSLIFAVVYPRIRRAAYERRVDAAVFDIETLEAAARSHFEREGTWPGESPAGMMPAELVGALSEDFTFEWEHYTLDWNLWATVRTPEANSEDGAFEDEEDLDDLAVEEVDSETAYGVVPTIHPLAGITIHSNEQALLAMLMERYGPEFSFVQEGSWTLILEAAR